MHLRYLRYWWCQIFCCLTIAQCNFCSFSSCVVECPLWLVVNRMMTCWGAVCELLDYRSSAWLSIIMQDWTGWSCVLPMWFQCQLRGICDRAATPTFLPACSISVHVSQCFLCPFSLSGPSWLKNNFFFFYQKIKLSVGSVSCCDLSCSCSEDQTCQQWCCGTARWGCSVQQSLVAVSVYVDQENVHMILAGSWAQNGAVPTAREEPETSYRKCQCSALLWSLQYQFF